MDRGQFTGRHSQTHYYQGRKDFSESLWPRVHLEDAVLWMRQPLAEPRASGGVNRGSWEEHWLFKLLGFKSGFIFTLPSQPVLLQVIELLKSTVMYCNWLLRGCCIDGTSILLYQCTKRRCGKTKKKKKHWRTTEASEVSGKWWVWSEANIKLYTYTHNRCLWFLVFEYKLTQRIQQSNSND